MIIKLCFIMILVYKKVNKSFNSLIFIILHTMFNKESISLKKENIRHSGGIWYLC